jgi:hypothetical protein
VLGPGDEGAVSKNAQGGEQVGLANAQGIAELLSRQWARRGVETLEDTCLERVGGGWGRILDVGILNRQMGGVAGDEAEAERRGRTRAAVLDHEHAVVAVAGEVEPRIKPGREITRTAELLRGMGGGRLAHVVDEQDGDIELALQRAQRAEHGRDLAGTILVEPSDQADEWIEDEQPGFVQRDGPPQPVEVAGVVEAELGDVEQEQWDLCEVEAVRARDAVEADAQVGRRVLGAEEQDRTGVGDGKPAERLGAGGDRERKLDGDEGLERLGGPPSSPTEALVCP